MHKDGTQPPRHGDAEARAACRPALGEQPKDRAENVMIVDLLRNDLDGFCEAGPPSRCRNVGLEATARAPISPRWWRASSAPGAGLVDLAAGLHAGGLDQRRPETCGLQRLGRNRARGPAGPYCGSLFRLGADGQLRQANILIRSLMLHGRRLRAHAGCASSARLRPGGRGRRNLGWETQAPCSKALG